MCCVIAVISGIYALLHKYEVRSVPNVITTACLICSVQHLLVYCALLLCWELRDHEPVMLNTVKHIFAASWFYNFGMLKFLCILIWCRTLVFYQEIDGKLSFCGCLILRFLWKICSTVLAQYIGTWALRLLQRFFLAQISEFTVKRKVQIWRFLYI